MLASQQQQQGTVSSARIVECFQWLYKEGYKIQTIQSHSRILRFLDKNCNLADPETVREFLASRHCSSGRKENIVDCYSKYAKFCGIAFSEPRYTREDSLPFVPLQKEIETLIEVHKEIPSFSPQ